MNNILSKLFCKEKKVIIGRGVEVWVKYDYTFLPNGVKHERDYVDYKITNLTTGSESIKREYLN